MQLSKEYPGSLHPYLEHLVDTVRSVPTHPMYFDFPIPMSLKQRLITSALYFLSSYDAW